MLDKFQKFYPEELKNGLVKNYYEPFLGGGAVFFDVAQRFSIRQAFLYDINEELILTYKVVQRDVAGLVHHLKQLRDFYANLDEEKQKAFYYQVRKEFNQAAPKIGREKFTAKWIERAAQIIFLNKTCFNGLFRFNSKGEFNVPAGRYKNPKILDEQNLFQVSKLLANAEINVAGFESIKRGLKKHSFVYFDPPYRPISKTSSFTSYSKNNFGDEQQIELAKLFHQLHKSGAKLMLSNSDPKNIKPDDEFFDELYKKFHLFRIPAKRMINSDASKRQEVMEIVVTNYQVKK